MPELPYHPSSTDGELLPVVDENDAVIGSATRREVHLRHLLHRAVHGVVVNSRGEVLLQLRSRHKDSHPGFWDIGMGGHVDAHEEYEDAARREFREELGIANPVFREVGRRSADAESGWEFIRLYECLSDGPFAPAEQEIDELRWVAPEELFTRYRAYHDDPALRVTGSGYISLVKWGELTGRLPQCP